MPFSYFAEELLRAAPSQDLLPFFHSCDGFYFRAILENRKLATSKCSVFNDEELLYLFYGRPAYKSANQKSTSLPFFFPVAFILNSESIGDIKRIAPFDTGAFKKGLYSAYLHENMSIDKFLLRPEKATISKAINYFFESNEDYFLGKPKNEIKYDAFDFEVAAYHNLIKNASQTNEDDRKASFEIQLEHEILLTEESLEAVIMPVDFKNAELVQEIIVKELKAKVIFYDSFGIASGNYYANVLSLTKSYLIQKCCLNDN